MKNVIGRLGKPRLKLIKALAREKYGERNHSAMEINTVIAENELQLYKSNGSLRPEKQIANAMSIAAKMMKKKAKVQTTIQERIGHHPSCGCASCKGGHIVISPHT
jgi:hypothetical protein